MDLQYNLRSPAVKRLMKESEELREATEEYYAQPLEDNLFEWHFTVRGPPDSHFQGGYYHGRIILPNEYPMKPPSIILLTPNGRFEINKKICLSISGHHPESWQPSWSIRTALLAIIGFMPTESLGAIGSLDYSAEERKSLAQKSHCWSCPSCGLIISLLRESTEQVSEETENSKEAKELAKQICFKGTDNSSSTKNSTIQEDSASLNANQTSESDRQEFQEESSPSEAAVRKRLNKEESSVEAARDTNQAEQPQQIYRQIQPQLLTQTAENLAPSRTRFSTYIILFLTATIAFLIFRRVFLIA